MQPAGFFIAAAGTLLTLVDGSPVTQCSSSTTILTSSFSGFTSEGCFTEAAGKRALTGKTLIDDTITVEKCSSFCSAYNYFGLENGRECYCGNALMAGSVPTRLSECSSPCPGNTGELCGAVSRLSIYSKTISTSSASGSVSVASGSDSGASPGSSGGSGGNTSGNGSGSGAVTTKSPSVTPGSPLSTNIIVIVASVPSSYPWSNTTAKAISSATLPTLSRPGTGVLPSPSTISISKSGNSTTISSAFPTNSTNSSFLAFNSSTLTLTSTSSESTIPSTSLFVSTSSSSASTTFSSSSFATSSAVAAESSSSSASLESLTTSILISTSSLDETSITSIPALTTIISSSIEPTSSIELSSTLTTLLPTSSAEPSAIESTTISEPVSSSIPTPAASSSDPTSNLPSTLLTSTASSTSSTASPASTNLVSDGDFEALSESSTIPWTPKYTNTYLTYNFENPTTQATTYGARSASITINQYISGSLAWFNQPVTLSANTVYNFSANTKASVANPGCITYYYIGAADGATVLSILSVTASTGLSTNWITNTATYTSTAVTDVTINVRLVCQTVTSTTAKTYYFDNIQLVAATAAATPV